MKNTIKQQIDSLRKNGFFSIFLATILSKVVTLLGGIILIRILSKSDYGVYSYIHNCFSMLFILSDFGISSAALQYLAENNSNQKKKDQILMFSIKACLIVAFITGVLIWFSPYFYPYTMKDAIKLTQMLFFIPFITIINDLLSVVLRANFENKKYGKIQIFTTVITYVFLIIFALLYGVKGAILSQYLYGIIVLIYSIISAYPYILPLRKRKIHEKIPKKEKKEFLKYAFSYQLNNTISGLLLIVDTFLIGYMISSADEIANYSVGSKLPYALNFLSTCIAIYIIPHFIKHNKDFKWLNQKFNTLIKYSFIGFSIFCIGLILFSKPIFLILFGAKYFEAIPIYIVLVIGLFFNSAFKCLCTNILGALRKLKINIIVNIISIIFNFITNIFFIKWFGVLGAAITTTMTNIMMSLFYLIYLKKYLKKMNSYKKEVL